MTSGIIILNIFYVTDEILSSLKSAPTSDFIYSSLSFFGEPKGGELPGTWFVRAMGSLGLEETAVRQTLFRMEKEGALRSRRSGRIKLYRPSVSTRAILEAGRERVRAKTPSEWDGLWTLVHFRVGEGDREGRDRLRDVLRVEGFGALGPGFYLHPHDRIARLLASARDLGLDDRLNIFRGPHLAGLDARQLVRMLWPLEALAVRYGRFIDRFRPVAAAPVRRWSPKEAFGLRFAVMFEFFRISWDDPGLPPSLAPPGWPGEKARRMAEELLKKLNTPALTYAEQVLSGDTSGH